MSSSSKSSQSSKTEQHDKRVGADNGAIAIGEGSDITIQTTDAGAWELGGEAIRFAFEANQSVVGMAESIIDNAAVAVERAQAQAENHTKDGADKTAALAGTLAVAALGAYVITRMR